MKTLWLGLHTYVRWLSIVRGSGLPQGICNILRYNSTIIQASSEGGFLAIRLYGLSN